MQTIKASDVRLTIDHETMLTDFQRAKIEGPMLRRIVGTNSTIHMSRKFGFPKDGLWGEPVLCGFGESRIGQLHHGAPEVLFKMEWSHDIGIWNVAAMVRAKSCYRFLGYFAVSGFPNQSLRVQS